MSILVESARAGDLDSFTRIVNRYQARVYAFALARLSNGADAEEIVQETWLRAFVNLRHLRNPESLGAWLFSICGNCVNQFLRKKERAIPIQDIDPELVMDEDEMDDWRGYTDLLGLVLDQLTAANQDLIRLKYCSGLKNREISAVLGIAPALVKSRLHEARAKIKELLPGLSQDMRLSQPRSDGLKEKIMSTIEFVRRGSHLVCRLSLENQVRICECASQGQRFDESLLKEIGQIEGGLDFIKDCDARLPVSDLADILAACDEGATKRILERLDQLHQAVCQAVRQSMIISSFTEEAQDESLSLRSQSIDADPQCLVLYLSGYIDSFNAASVRKRLFRALEGGFTSLILHCGGFNYISSTGIGLFADLCSWLTSRGGSLILVKLHPAIHEVFELLGLTRFFSMKDSLEEALDAPRTESRHGEVLAPELRPIPRLDHRLFLPLGKDATGGRQSTASLDCGPLELFGYYAGTGDVSGDYFDFQRLDADHVAVIKSDVAGKGSPVFQTMAAIAGLYHSFFRDRSFETRGIQLEEFMYAVNDHIKLHGAEGRFATLVVMVIDIRTGECRICNAGDNQLLVCGSQGVRVHELMKAPAAGAFTSEVVMTQNGYAQECFRLSPGEAIFLFTDGMPEARRHFRDSSYAIKACDVAGDGEVVVNHAGTHYTGEDSEALGMQRIQEVVSAVYARSHYRLIKHHSPLGDNEDLSFDFRACKDTPPRDGILALASIERVFRLIPDPKSGNGDRISINPILHDFLREHFLQFGTYFKLPVERNEEAVVYTHLREDPQRDDIAILGIRRKENS